MKMKHRFSAWVLVTRPWAFSASVVPIVAVVAWLYGRFGAVDGLNALLSLATLVFLHAGTDVLSDCRDHECHVDLPGSPNGVTWIHDGRFGVGELRRYALGLLCVGAGLGLVAALRSTADVLWIGAAGVAIALGYSFLKYRALGDVAVFLAFTVLPSLGLGPVTVGKFVPSALLVALPPGLLTLAILNANNIRDVASDAAAGCRTFPMVAGRQIARTVYLAESLFPYALVAVFIAVGLVPYAAIGTFLTIPLAVRNVTDVREGALATLDRASAQLQLLFGVLYVIAFPVGGLGFWWQLSLASVVTGALALRFAPRDLCRRAPREVLLGGALAAALWGVFWVGEALSRMLFGFARTQVDAVYALRQGFSPWLVAALLLFLIGPAEELFWRGLVQRGLAACWGATAGFVAATACYALVHVFSGNVMLVCAAAVCGGFWGLFYRFFPRHLPALVISHALWDVAVFVVFPIG